MMYWTSKCQKRGKTGMTQSNLNLDLSELTTFIFIKF